MTVLDHLTTEQAAAATTTDREAYVQAGPGTGKTRTLIARIVHLIEAGEEPERIVAFAFTRNAASEIRERLAKAVGHAVAARVEVTTFHAFAARLVVPDGFRVATETDAAQAVETLYKGPTRRPRGSVCGIRELQRSIMAHEAANKVEHPRVVALVLDRMRRAKLIATWDLLPRLLPDCFAYDHVLVDEAQDVTSRELQVARWLCEGGTLFAVGDPRQAIFGWRGAVGWDSSPTHALTSSFRFGPEIADAANWVAARFGADPIEGVGAPGVVETSDPSAILVQDGTRAVLCRTHVECSRVARELGDQAVHIKRDPLDAFAREDDRFADVAARGLVAVTTVHASKGREWDSVAVGPLGDSDEELRVAYVAVTRGRGWVSVVE